MNCLTLVQLMDCRYSSSCRMKLICNLGNMSKRVILLFQKSLGEPLTYSIWIQNGIFIMHNVLFEKIIDSTPAA